MDFLYILSTAIILSRFASAAPTVAFPINSQVPPVARVSKPFSYTFSSSTFYSTSPITYKLSTAPSWLLLDSDTRTLSGTPSPSDVGEEDVTGINIDVTATDSTGSITSNTTIVISKNPAPVIDIPVSEQIPKFGDAISTPSKLLYHPSTPFKFSFDSATFSDTAHSSLKYYSINTDYTPLPSWIQFDASTLSFSGQTPEYASLIQPPQTFGVQLIASDVEGFGGSSLLFSIEVGVHLLAFKNEYMVMNVTAGGDATFDGLTENLQLDGTLADSASIVSIVADTPAWMAFDNTTLKFSGTPTQDARSRNITVHATDKFGDIANATIYINIGTVLFDGTIEILNATVGAHFSFDLSTYLRQPSSTDLVLQFSSGLSWASFEPKAMTLSGQVPDDFHAMEIDGTLNATSTISGISESQSFKLFISPKASKTSSSNPTATPAPGHGASHKGLSKSILAAIMVPPVIVIILLLLILFWCCQRRRQTSRRYHPNSNESDQSVSLEEGFANIEKGRSSVVQVPEFLPLDTSGFGDSASSICSSGFKRKIGLRFFKPGMRHSRTMSTVMLDPAPSNDPAAPSNIFGISELGSGVASPKEIEIENPTPEIAAPVVDAPNVSPQRLVRNYSRKGHARRSGQVWSKDYSVADSTSSAQPKDKSILNLQDSSFATAPITNYTALASRIPENPEAGSSTLVPDAARAARRNSKRFSSHLERARSGVGHGSRHSASPSHMGTAKRRSVGHGQDRGYGLNRDSKTWATLNTAASERNRRSYASYKTDTSEVLDGSQSTNTTVMPVSPVLARTSGSSTNGRPISRRIVGASPFFHGRSTSRASKRMSPEKGRVSYADSPTVPEEAILGNLDGSNTQDENAIIHSHGVTSYSSPREGTRQLRSFLNSRLQKSKTKSKSSMKSVESRDSRFESASPSVASIKYFQSMNQVQDDVVDTVNDDDGYEEFLPEEYSEEDSWETHQSGEENQPNIITHGPPSSVDIATPEVPSSTGGPKFVSLKKLDPETPMLDIGLNARMVSGRGKKPVNVGTAGKGSVKARIECADEEDDYTAYI